MSRRPTYYVIELSSRWLTALVVAMALVVVLAFALGYGAARGGAAAPVRGVGGPATPTPGVATAEVGDQGVAVVVSAATPVAPEPTITPGAGWERPPSAPEEPSPTPEPPATATAPPTAAPEPTATPAPEEPAEGIWVQVLATRSADSVRSARQQLEGLGFPAEHQRVVSTPVAGGDVMYKVRVGPFPNRDSADRVVRRMKSAGFADAWVVTP